MSLMEAIRRATGGKPRMEDKKPDEMEEDETDTSAEGDEKDVDAEDDEETAPDAEGEEKDPDAEDDEEIAPDAEDEEDKKMTAADRKVYGRGRKAERKRLAKILGSKAAEANPALAAHLAFNTSDSAGKALAALKASGPSAVGNLASRMAGRNSRTGRGGEAPAGKRDAGAAWDKAMAAAGVKAKGK